MQENIYCKSLAFKLRVGRDYIKKSVTPWIYLNRFGRLVGFQKGKNFPHFRSLYIPSMVIEIKGEKNEWLAYWTIR